MIFIPVLLSVGIWAWLLVGRGAFWRSGPVLGTAHPTRPLKVTVVIPARDEFEHISDTLRSLLTQQFEGELRIVLVDDNSSDGTGALALELAETDARLRVVVGAPLKTGWTGKMWAHPPGFCLEIFFWGEFLCFCRGFWRKRAVEGGFLVVNLWWNRGELWCVDGRIWGSKICHFLKIYFEGFPFWDWVTTGRSNQVGIRMDAYFELVKTLRMG
jgi:hypothetical protein